LGTIWPDRLMHDSAWRRRSSSPAPSSPAPRSRSTATSAPPA